MDAVLNQIRILHANADEDERQHMNEQLRDVQRELASNFDLVWSLASGVRPGMCNCGPITKMP